MNSSSLRLILEIQKTKRKLTRLRIDLNVISSPLMLIPLMIITLLIFASVIGRFNFSHDKYDSLSRTSSIDGLRALLAVGVLTHHFYITYTWKLSGKWSVPTYQAIGNLGAIPVSLFFMITGFLFIRKIKQADVSWRTLFLGRVMRIYPLYAFVGVMVMLIAVFSTTNGNIHLSNYLSSILRWLAFKNTWVGDIHTGIVVAGVNWTLLYEWGFYLALPFISYVYHKRLSDKYFLLIIAFVLLYILYSTNLKMYVLFALAAITTVNMPSIKKLISQNKLVIDVVLICIIMSSLFFTKEYSILQMFCVLVIFIFISNGASLLGFLNIKGMKIIGDISYSIYITHGLVLYISFSMLNMYNFKNGIENYFLYYPFILLATIILSFGTYNFIEKPFFHSARKKSFAIKSS